MKIPNSASPSHPSSATTQFHLLEYLEFGVTCLDNADFVRLGVVSIFRQYQVQAVSSAKLRACSQDKSETTSTRQKLKSRQDQDSRVAATVCQSVGRHVGGLLRCRCRINSKSEVKIFRWSNGPFSVWETLAGTVIT